MPSSHLVKEMGHSGNSSGTQRESEGKLMSLLLVLQEQNQKGEFPTQRGSSYSQILNTATCGQGKKMTMSEDIFSFSSKADLLILLFCSGNIY